MEEKRISEQESLELITRMIKETQEYANRKAAYPFLIWGYTTVFVTLAVWGVGLRIGFSKASLLWLVLPIVGGLLMYVCREREEEVRVKNHVERFVGHIWLVLGCLGGAYSLLSGWVSIPILFIIVLLMSIGVTLTGLAIKLSSLTVCGAIGLCLSFVFHFMPNSVMQLPVFAFTFVVMMIVPGHIMHCKLKSSCKN